MHVVHLLAGACAAADPAAIELLLAPGVVAVCDGGGQVPAPPEPVRGAAEVALLLAGLFAGLLLTVSMVNGGPGIVGRRDDGSPVAVLVATGSAREIGALWIVLNPGKLHRWTLYS
ncbi:siderophore-interacting protein [Paractinoplanes maris]|uniref:siderophore-interacting protein n=1 Tax=Paractinoplanes maris TaxID=1734446 RepID=UPI002022689E|nr:siderophore-interacting protein [Actinoplanes maris]